MASDWNSTALLMGVIVFGSLYIVSLIKEERLEMIRAFFFLNGILNIFFSFRERSSVYLFFIMSANADSTSLGGLGMAYGTMNALFIVFVAWAYGSYLFERFFDKSYKLIVKGGK